MMDEAERYAMETLAAEAERLRTDPSFSVAVLAIYKAAEERLADLNKQLVDGVLSDADLGPLRAAVVQERATIEAIDRLTTEIANQILRGKARSLKPVA